jgi:hemerythrin-like metal-binding protein
MLREDIMAMLEWRDSFSVGISVLDADHRQLIELINQLQEARDAHRGAAVVQNVLAELGEHVREHFEREEALMARAGYPESEQHRSHHRRTTEQIAHFASLSRDGEEFPMQVLEFMKAWFSNHVICQDLKLLGHFQAAGMVDVKAAGPADAGSGLVRRLGRSLAVMRLRSRILLLALVPLVAFVVGAVVGAMDRFQSAGQLETMVETAALGADIGGLVHELQKERGMSSLFLGSKGAKMGPELEAQRKLSDQRKATMDQAAAAALVSLRGTVAAERLAKAQSTLSALAELRGKVSGQSLEPKQAIAAYSGTIADLLAVLEGMQRSATNAALLRDISVYLNAVQLKEQAGQERATGAAGFAAASFPPELFQRFATLGAAQQTYERSLLAVAEADMVAVWRAANSGAAADEVAGFRQAAFASVTSGQGSGVDPQAWFKAATARIDQLKTAEDRFAGHLVEDATARQAEARASAWTLTIAIVVVLVVVLLLAAVLNASIVPPLEALTRTMRAMADGEHSLDIPCATLKDELGAMARALEFFKEQLIVADLRSAQGWVENVEQTARLTRKGESVSRFDAEMSDFLGRLGASVDTLRAVAETMSMAASDTSTRATAASAATEQAAVNVQTVASAAEELSGSITEISRQVAHSEEIAGNASDQARQAEAAVSELDDATRQIGQVVQLITDIAAQTNLLALNATIEAARAGDAGKGFAVVAGEVKTLANQTAKATEEIAGQVGAVQQRTAQVVQVIRTIVTVIEEVRAVAGSIAAAVEQQSAATREIARNVEQAASGTAEISGNVVGVLQAAESASGASQKVLDASAELSDDSVQLRERIRTFLTRISEG